MAFMEQMRNLARLQGQQNDALFENLRHRVNAEAEAAAEIASSNLDAAINEFAQANRLDAKILRRYFGGQLYPTQNDSVAIFHADFQNVDGWKEAAITPIGDLSKRAKILPVAMTTKKAMNVLSQAESVFERENIQPVVIEIGEKYSKLTRHPAHQLSSVSVPVVGLSPDQVMKYLCKEIGMQQCALQAPLSR